MEQNPSKTYTQEEVDSIVASVKDKAKAKYEGLVASNYVSKDDFVKLQQENSDLTKQVRTPAIQKALISAGCKQECVNDLIQLNGALLEVGDNDIKAKIEECRSQRPYMFNSSFAAETGNNSAPSKNSDNENTIEGSVGTIITRTTKI